MAKILIVDDDAATRLLVTTLLTHAGHEVFEAADGSTGLDLAARCSAELLLVDLSLPVMAGTEMIRAVRARRDLATLMVALYTATPIDAALRDFMELYRVCDAIPKPSDPQEFLLRIETALASGH